MNVTQLGYLNMVSAARYMFKGASFKHSSMSLKNTLCDSETVMIEMVPFWIHTSASISRLSHACNMLCWMMY